MPESNAAWRRSNIGHVLFAASDRFLADKLEWIHTHGFPEMTEAQLTLLLSLDPDGTRPTDIAARTNLTKSAIAELIGRAEQRQLVERHPDPADNRGRIVRFSPPGRTALATIQAGIERAEQGFVNIAGADFTARFRRALGAYAADLAIRPDGTDSNRPHEWHNGNAGRVLALSARRFVREVLSIVHAGGHREIGEAMLALIRNLDLDGTRLTELAARAHMTKPSMRELVDRAEALRLVDRTADPVDRRAKSIAFTTLGLAMLDDMRTGVIAAEERLGERIGAPFLHEIHHVLRAYVAQGGQRHRLGPILAPTASA